MLMEKEEGTKKETEALSQINTIAMSCFVSESRARGEVPRDLIHEAFVNSTDDGSGGHGSEGDRSLFPSTEWFGNL